MTEAAPSVLPPWANFYITTGSSAAALTGLMFVVITLVTGEDRRRGARDGISTFSTPTVVHFGAALLVSEILSAPWRSLVQPATLLGLAGLCGVVYVLHLMRRTRRLRAYKADLEDWVWYTVLPFAAYASILAGAIALPAVPVNALFSLAGGALLLTFIGIHNAWDIVTYLTIGPGAAPSSSRNDEAEGGPRD
jgi:hypothetical protein